MLAELRTQPQAALVVPAVDARHKRRRDEARRATQSQMGAATRCGGGIELLAVAAVHPCAGSPSVLVAAAMCAALSTDAPKLVRHVRVMFK